MSYKENYKNTNTYLIKQTWCAAQHSGHRFTCGICNQKIICKGDGQDETGVWCLGYLTVDHIIPLSCSGTDDLLNLQPAHFRCNQIKSSNMDEYEVRAQIKDFQLEILDRGFQRYLGRRLASWIF